jgi:hypothetical protein
MPARRPVHRNDAMSARPSAASVMST